MTSRALSGSPLRKLWGVSPFAVWLAIAVCLTFVVHVGGLNRRFDWMGAHFSLMARSYVEHGILGVGVVPIQNNPPLGPEPDRYLHWPPLFPMILSFAFRLFNESESVARCVMLVVLLATCLALYSVVKAGFGREAGLVAAFTLLVMPVTVAFAGVVLHLHLAILGLLVAILAFIRACGPLLDRRWATFGSFAFTLAVWTSWEPLLAIPGLLAAALWSRRRVPILLSIVYATAGMFAFLSILTIYIWTAPELAAELWHTVKGRMGLGPYWPTEFHVHMVFDEPAPVSFGRVVLQYLSYVELIGQIGVVALGWAVVRGWVARARLGDGRGALLFGGLAAPWVLWLAIMWRHSFYHHYQMALAVPVTSAAIGWGTAMLYASADRRGSPDADRAVRWVVAIVLPALMLLPLTQSTLAQFRKPERQDSMLDYALAVKETTEPEAIVLSPPATMVFAYYSRRHVIRAVDGDAKVERITGKVAELFPRLPVYLAFPPTSVGAFPRSLERYPVVAQNEHLILLGVSLPEPRTKRSALESPVFRSDE